MKDSGHPSSPSDPFERFPAPVYSETVLSVNFDDAKKYFFDALIEIHAAHTLMLSRQRIIPEADARCCLDGLAKLDRNAILAARYDGRCEDLFFYVQGLLVQECGAEAAGKMHTARSRNDIDITQYRMCLRREMLRIAAADRIGSPGAARCGCRAHRNPHAGLYAHAAGAAHDARALSAGGRSSSLGRDDTRLQAAFATVNRNPLGACAITTTGFPIDRECTAELLGFEGLQTNSYGAIAAIDYVTEPPARSPLMVNLGKLTQDLLLWSTAEFGFLRLATPACRPAASCRRSAIRSRWNTRASWQQGVGRGAGRVHLRRTIRPFGDIVDSEDDLQPLVFSMSADALRALRLLAGLMSQPKWIANEWPPRRRQFSDRHRTCRYAGARREHQF